MTDARFADADPAPLALLAGDAEDLTVISTLVQDAVLQVSDVSYDSRHRQLALLLNRFRWEDAEQARRVGELFDLTAEERQWLQVVPSKGSLATAVPTDPLIYRLYEIVSVYGGTMKELIHEEFGDGIMSAIDFSMDIQREPHPKGDLVRIVLSGKFLPYLQY